MTKKTKVSFPFTCRLFILLVCVFMLTLPLGSGAKSDTVNNTVGFTVKAVIPQNQIDSSVTYFDLFMKPEKKQTLKVYVYNQADQDIYIQASAISASTSSNGIIDYKTPDILNETLLHPFAQLAEIEHPRLLIKANQHAIVYVDVTMPEEPYDGVVLGSIVITKELEEPLNTSQPTPDPTPTPAAQNGAAITNQYSYIIGVKLTMTDTPVSPDFELLQVVPQLVYYRPAITHSILNNQPLIIKGMKMELAITNSDTNEIVLQTDKIIDMAPNSVIDFPARLERGSLPSGNYISHVTLTLDDKEWLFEKAFVQE